MSLFRASRLFQRRAYIESPRNLLGGRFQAGAFSSSATRPAGKESALHEDSDKRADEVENAKQDQLKKQKDGENHFKEELASDSETAVKADRHEIKDAAKDIKNMQEQTAKDAEKKGN